MEPNLPRVLLFDRVSKKGSKPLADRTNNITQSSGNADFAFIGVARVAAITLLGVVLFVGSERICGPDGVSPSVEGAITATDGQSTFSIKT